MHALSMGMLCLSQGIKACRSVRIVRSVRTVKWRYGPYEPYGSWEWFTDREHALSMGMLCLSQGIKACRVRTNCKMALRIVRFVKMIYGSWTCFVDGVVVFKSGHKSLSIRTDRIRSVTNCKMALRVRTVRENDLRIVNILCPSVKSVNGWCCVQVRAEKFVDPYGSYGPYELWNGFTDRTIRKYILLVRL